VNVRGGCDGRTQIGGVMNSGDRLEESEMVQRYDIECKPYLLGATMARDEYGEWVAWDDYEALRKERDEALQAIEELEQERDELRVNAVNTMLFLAGLLDAKDYPTERDINIAIDKLNLPECIGCWDSEKGCGKCH